MTKMVVLVYFSLISLSLMAREHHYRKPDIVEENLIDILEGRHPLQEVCTTPFVPNPTLSGNTSDQGKITILTGPNASGKSVYLKQIGLIVLLAHVGGFVPAEKARIGCCDRIFTRIHTVDSVQSAKSTFATDVAQMSTALNDATKRSLVIVDEFGKGTVREIGVSLLASCLEFLISKGAESPHVFLASHLHSIFQFLPQSSLVKFQSMEVMRQDSELVFLYQLTDTICRESHASFTALNAGILAPIVQRSTQLLESVRNGTDGYGQGVPSDSLDAENLARRAILVEKLLEFNPANDHPSTIFNLILNRNSESPLPPPQPSIHV